ncbi:MAG: hypothetical protein JJ975_01965 [Bacteroidia bacterium]|nr:hypothetical protein [Bacteroidia bacterium]
MAQSWSWNGNTGSGKKLGFTSYNNLNLYTNDAIRTTITKDGDVGIGLVNPRARMEVLYCPVTSKHDIGLIVTYEQCPGSNASVFDATLPDFIGGLGLPDGTNNGEGHFSLPFSFLTNHITQAGMGANSNSEPVFWVRSESPAGVPSNPTGVTEFDTKFIVMPDGSTGINVAHPRAALDVRGSQSTNHPAAIFGSRAIGTGSTNPMGLFQYQTQQIQIIPVLGDKGYNAISKSGDQGVFFSDGKGADGANRNGSLVIAPWTDQIKNPTTGGMKIDSNGNLGVFGHLDVYGDIKSHKLTVRSFSWPDYVFDSTYSLMSLEHLEKFITKNKHLPDVPSEIEVKEQGIDIARTQELILRKIEELTLYVIEHDKKINVLTTKLNEPQE